MASHSRPDTFVQVVDVHGSNPVADAGRAAEAALMLYPRCRILGVRPTERMCRHGYPLWAVEVSGPDPRIAYVPGLCGPPIRHLLECDGVP